MAKRAALIGTLALAGAFVVVPVSAAHAATSCGSIYYIGTTEASVTCSVTNGSSFRVYGTCWSISSNSSYTAYGPWRTTTSTSSAYCKSGYEMGTGHVQTADL
jgi:hypothetical protein